MRALSFHGAAAGWGPGFAPRFLRVPPLSIRAGGTFMVEFRAGGEMHDAIEPWRALAARALEPALFAEPDLVLPGLQHLEGGRHVSLMLVWRHTTTGRILRGVFPLASPRLTLGPREARLWQPGPEAVGGPLIDREQPEATIEAALRGLCAPARRHAGLTLPALAEDGPIAHALADAAALSGRRLDRFASARAVWIAAPDGPEGGHAPGRDASRVRADAGARVTLEQARGPREIRDAVETFLVLDALAANAAGRAPLVQDPGVASFVRTTTRHFARARRCRVDTLWVADAAAAAAISFETADAVWVWASAGRPDAEAQRQALLPPIVLRARRGRKTLYLLDGALVTAASAAGLGLRRAPLADHFVPTRPGASASAAAVHFRQRFDRGLRRMVHVGLRRLRGLTGPTPA